LAPLTFLISIYPCSTLVSINSIRIQFPFIASFSEKIAHLE
jgi:hypothetical protein